MCWECAECRAGVHRPNESSHGVDASPPDDETHACRCTSALIDSHARKEAAGIALSSLRFRAPKKEETPLPTSADHEPPEPPSERTWS